MIHCEVRTSRGWRRCGGQSAAGCRAIKAGERYVASSASPHHDDLGNPGWWHMNLCSPCVAYYNNIPAAIKAEMAEATP